MDIEIEKLDTSSLDEVKTLIENYPFSDYRRYKTVKADKEYLYRHITSANENIMCAMISGKLAGIISFKMLPWDTSLFGIKMGKIEHIIVSSLLEPAAQRTVIEILLQGVSDFAKRNNIQHISIKADTDDNLLIIELQRAGFYIADCLITYINEINVKQPDIPSLFNIREYRRDDKERIIEISQEAYKNYSGRFNTDPHIPRDKGLEFYIEWTKNCCNGSMADVMLVAERKGKVIGFICHKLNEILNGLSGKIKYGGHGLSAASKEGKGAYVSLVAALVKHSVAASTIVDYDTQINNFDVIRIWNKLGLSYVRSKYTFHKWLG